MEMEKSKSLSDHQVSHVVAVRIKVKDLIGMDMTDFK